MLNKYYLLLFLTSNALAHIITDSNQYEISYLDTKNNIYVCRAKHEEIYLAHVLHPMTQQIIKKFEGEIARKMFKDIELAYHLPKARL